MHRHADDVLIGLLQFGEQGVRKQKQFLLLGVRASSGV